MLKIEKRRAYKARTVCQWCIIISLCMYTSRLMLLILGIKNNCTLPYFQSSLLSSMSNFFFFGSCVAGEVQGRWILADF